MDCSIKPYVKDNPQLTGVLWRIRCDRMPVSYGPSDLALFSRETGVTLPAGTEKEQAAWAATGPGRVPYDDWWHRKRAQFHIKLAELLKSYRSDLTLYYYNWDGDKFWLIKPNITSWAFVQKVVFPRVPAEGGRAAYEKDRQARKNFTAADYIAALRVGNFEEYKGINRADYGIRPELYKDAKGIQIFAPANYLCYELPDYLNYFQTADGLAVSHAVSYDEIGRCWPNPQYECSMVTPGGGNFSMALELLDYFHGDARTLTWTAYTYGRGFAAEHRRFAQAFLALPAIPGTAVEQGDKDLKVRTYPSANGTYVGVAYKGYTARKLTIRVPAGKPGAVLKNLVTNQTVPTTAVGNDLQFEINSDPMELDAFLIQ